MLERTGMKELSNRTATFTDSVIRRMTRISKVSAEALTCVFFGGPSGGRTLDLGIKSPLLYQLS